MNGRKKLRRQFAGWLVLSAALLAVFVFLEGRPVVGFSAGKEKSDAGVLATTVPDADFVRSLPLLDVDVYAAPRSRVGRLVAAFLAPYTRVLRNNQPAVRLRFIDPASNPARVRMNRVDVNGEMLLRLRNDMAESPLVLHLQALDTELFLNTWWRLARAARGKQPPWLFVAQQDGSRAIDTEASDGIGRWVRSLQKGGYRVTALPMEQIAKLATAQGRSAILLPAPASPVPAELQALASETPAQIGLWWLTEPELATAQPGLELALGLVSLPDEKPAMTDAPEDSRALLALGHFTDDPLVQRMPQAVLMPGTLAFAPENTRQPGDWRPLLADARGRQVVWYRPQAVVVGDSDFISNAYINQGGNQVLAARLLDYLLGWPHYVPVQASHGGQLIFTQPLLVAYSLALLFGLPLLFLLVAVWRWWVDRRLLR